MNIVSQKYSGYRYGYRYNVLHCFSKEKEYGHVFNVSVCFETTDRKVDVNTIDIIIDDYLKSFSDGYVRDNADFLLTGNPPERMEEMCAVVFVNLQQQLLRANVSLVKVGIGDCDHKVVYYGHQQSIHAALEFTQ